MSVYKPNFLINLRKRPDVFGKFVQNILFFLYKFSRTIGCILIVERAVLLFFLSYIFSMLFV